MSGFGHTSSGRSGQTWLRPLEINLGLFSFVTTEPWAPAQVNRTAPGFCTLPTVRADVTEFVGVYDADSTLIGEVSYWIGARLGRTHCSLCELTHGVFTVKSEWKQCSRGLAVPFRTFHRNDAPADVLSAAAGRFPVVMARTGGGLVTVMDDAALERFSGDTGSFAHALQEWLGQRP